jgi:hypothetical protein
VSIYLPLGFIVNWNLSANTVPAHCGRTGRDLSTSRASLVSFVVFVPNRHRFWSRMLGNKFIIAIDRVVRQSYKPAKQATIFTSRGGATPRRFH